MIRSLLLASTVLLSTCPLFAQTEPPPGDDRRYQFNQVEDGYLRLDLQNGQVSICRRRDTGWACMLLPDDRQAFDHEIARLQAENASLKKALLDRGLPLPGGVTATAPPDRGRGDDAKPPGNADIDRVMSAIERMWRRLAEMIGRLQKDTDKP